MHQEEGVCTHACVRGVERGVERTHLPRYYCQSIIQGNARLVPWGRVHYALTTGSVLVSQPPRVIVCLRLHVCIFMHVSSQLNAPSSFRWGWVIEYFQIEQWSENTQTGASWYCKPGVCHLVMASHFPCTGSVFMSNFLLGSSNSYLYNCGIVHDESFALPHIYSDWRRGVGMNACEH